MKKRLLSLFLVAMVVLGAFPLAAFAAEETTPADETASAAAIQLDEEGNTVMIDGNGNAFIIMLKDGTVPEIPIPVKRAAEEPETKDDTEDEAALKYPGFKDVAEGQWYYDAVKYVYENGLFLGTGAGTFSPNSGMTRAMFVQVLANASDNYDPKAYTDETYDDVTEDMWCFPAVEWATDMGIVNGVGNGKFAPNALVTREQMARMLFTFAVKTDNFKAYTDEAFTAFPDTKAVSPWAEEAMKWATYHGIIMGSAEGDTIQLNPRQQASRAQVAQLFKNAATLLENRTVDKMRNLSIDLA